MIETIEIKGPSAIHPTPAPSQAFLTTPSPRCYEKVVRKRGLGLGGLANRTENKDKSLIRRRRETTKYRVRGEMKENGLKVNHHIKAFRNADDPWQGSPLCLRILKQPGGTPQIKYQYTIQP